MHKKLIKYIFLIIVFFAGFAVDSKAQFKEEAFTQTYNDDTTSVADTADKLFSIKEWAGGLAHKNKTKIGVVFGGSMIVPGTAQIYNKDYWKLPIVYGGIGALAGTGGYYLHQYKKTKKVYDNFVLEKDAFETQFGTPFPFNEPFVDYAAKRKGTWLMAGAGLVYWGSLLDGVLSYESDKDPDPGRATIYSILLPGLGQIYNGELFKVPIYWGCLMGSIYFLTNNNLNYVRFKRIHNEASADPKNVPISAETAVWYRDVYRRYRDYSIVATALFYFLQVIDANVFAYMHDFEVNDDISMNIEPAVIAPDNAYAIGSSLPYGTGQNAIGARISFRF